MTERERTRLAPGDAVAVVGRLAPDSGRVDRRLVAGTTALLTVGGGTVARILLNAPLEAPAWVGRSHGTLEAVTLIGLAVAAGAIALADDGAGSTVALLAVGTFAGLAAVQPAARVPAAGVAVGGGAVAAAAGFGRPTGWFDARRAVVGAALLVATAASLGSSMGLLGPDVRSLGTGLFLLGVAALPVFTSTGITEWTAGVAAGVAVVQFGLATPFVAGAVLLVGGGVVGVPLPLVALGVAGGVAAVAGGVRTRTPTVALGAALPLVAGVPGTLPRALAAVIGLTLLASEAGGGERP